MSGLGVHLFLMFVMTQQSFVTQISILNRYYYDYITTYRTSKSIVDVGVKREYAWTFIIADIKQPIIGADLKSPCLTDTRTGLAIPATLSSINPLSLNRVDTIVTNTQN